MSTTNGVQARSLFLSTATTLLRPIAPSTAAHLHTQQTLFCHDHDIALPPPRVFEACARCGHEYEQVPGTRRAAKKRKGRRGSKRKVEARDRERRDGRRWKVVTAECGKCGYQRSERVELPERNLVKRDKTSGDVEAGTGEGGMGEGENHTPLTRRQRWKAKKNAASLRSMVEKGRANAQAEKRGLGLDLMDFMGTI